MIHIAQYGIFRNFATTNKTRDMKKLLYLAMATFLVIACGKEKIEKELKIQIEEKNCQVKELYSLAKKMKENLDSINDKCPKCKDENIYKIEYGFVEIYNVNSLIHDKIVPGGCIKTTLSPNHFCNNCKNEW